METRHSADRPDIDQLKDRLERSWSTETFGGWRTENPALGQCAITALVVHDALGGSILKTGIAGEGWHFYNLIEGRRHDFTAGQFAVAPDYEDLPCSREEVLADTSVERYRLLRERVLGREKEPADAS